MATSISNVTGSISSAGLGSGINVEALVTQLMSVERRPLSLLQEAATGVNTKLSTVGKLQGHFSTLAEKANALTSTTLWNGVTATSSDTAAVTVAASAGAGTGSYDVNVSRLASRQTLTSSAVADRTAALGTGTLTIELGSWGSGTPASGFTPKAGSSAVTVNIGDGADSLAEVRDAINAADAGVVATIVTDASGARLSLRSAETGAENAFRISVAETVDDGDPAAGLSRLAYDASAATASPMSRTAEAANAEATVNGIAVSSASNTLTNVLDGLTLTLNKTTTSDVRVAVAADTAAIKTAITDFVGAFNTLASFIKTQTAYNADSKTAGALQGDQSTLALQSQLRGVLNASSSASGTWSVLSDIGLTLKSDGTLDTSAGRLDNALGNLGELRKLLTADGETSGESGFVRRFKRLADAVLSSDGSLATRTAGLRRTLDRNSKSQEAMENRLALTESRLRAQYQALDSQMAKLNSLSSYVSQQVATLASSS